MDSLTNPIIEKPISAGQSPKNTKIALVYSLEDDAGVNIANQIKKLGVPNWAEFYEVNTDIIFADLRRVKEDTVVFLSKHKSEVGTKSLTVHMLGNFGEAKFGGRARELSGTAPRIAANYLRALNEKNLTSGLTKQGFVVSLEVTHHGPLSQKNCVFIELGSSPIDWKNESAAKVIAETVIEATLKENKDKIVIGLGGGHYAPDFTKLCLRQNYAFGHICPRHQLENLSNDLVEQMLRKSGASEIILDWKGLKENKERVVWLCQKTKLPFERVQNLLK
jgi:D-aminoacyl-tRNA deacylase